MRVRERRGAATSVEWPPLCWRQKEVSLSGQTMVSLEETSGQQFQSVRETASFGKARF